MFLSTCVVCGTKKSSFIKNQELRSTIVLIKFKINKIINKFLLDVDNFMPDLHLRQPGFTYIACGLFTNHCERIQKFKGASMNE